MRADGYLMLACALPFLWILGRGLINMFIYDEYGFRFSRQYHERVEEDHRALDELVKQLTPCVLAIRRQPQPLVGGAAYSFRPGDYGQPLQLDRVEFFSAQTRAPAPVDSFPPECAPLLQKLDGAGVRRAFAQFAQKRRSLRKNHRLVVQKGGVTLVAGGFFRLPGIAMDIHVDDKGERAGARTRSS